MKSNPLLLLLIIAVLLLVLVAAALLILPKSDLDFSKSNTTDFSTESGTNNLDQEAVKSGIRLCEDYERALKRNRKEDIRAAEEKISKDIETFVAGAREYWANATNYFQENTLHFLGQNKNVMVVEFLADTYPLCDEPKKRVAVNSLARIAGRTAFRKLLELYSHETSPFIRKAIAEAALSIGNVALFNILDEISAAHPEQKDFYSRLRLQIQERSGYAMVIRSIQECDLSNDEGYAQLENILKSNRIPAADNAALARLSEDNSKNACVVVQTIIKLNDPENNTANAATRTVLDNAIKVLCNKIKAEGSLLYLLLHTSETVTNKILNEIDQNYDEPLHKVWISHWLKVEGLKPVHEKLQLIFTKHH